MNFKTIFAASLSIFSLASCEKVIKIDLNSSNPQYIIEGIITDDTSHAMVRVTKSVNYDQPDTYPAVTNAIVILNDDLGSIDTLEQTEPGRYQGKKLKGHPGRAYTMQVFVDGQTFLSSCTMPEPVSLDSLYMTALPVFGKEIIAPVVMFKDPESSANYYHFIAYKNNKRLKIIYYEHDQAINGKPVAFALKDTDVHFVNDDEVTVEMQCISKAVYDYYFSLQQTIGQSSATPTNPVTNIAGSNVTGYFSAHTKMAKTIKIQ